MRTFCSRMHSFVKTSLVCVCVCVLHASCTQCSHTSAANGSVARVECITCEKSQCAPSTKTKYMFQLGWRFCLTFRNKTHSGCIVGIAIHANFARTPYSHRYGDAVYALESRGTWHNGGIWFAGTAIGEQEEKNVYEEEPFPRQIQSCVIPTVLVFSALQQPYLLLLYLCTECRTHSQEPARYGDTLDYYYSAFSIRSTTPRRNNFSFSKSLETDVSTDTPDGGDVKAVVSTVDWL